MWGLCTLLVVAEARARAHSGRSLRVWWMLNLVAASYHLYFDLDEARSVWPHPRTALVLPFFEAAEENKPLRPHQRRF